MRAGLLVALAVLVLDQASKAALIGVMAARGDEPLVLTGFFRLVMVWNRGVSFGVLNDSLGGEWRRWVLLVVALVIVGGLVYWLARAGAGWLRLTLGAIIGGALGNAIDRVRFGAVADFFDVHLGDWHWPAFNVADAAISLGVVVLVLDGLLRRGPKAT